MKAWAARFPMISFSLPHQLAHTTSLGAHTALSQKKSSFAKSAPSAPSAPSACERPFLHAHADNIFFLFSNVPIHPIGHPNSKHNRLLCERYVRAAARRRHPTAAARPLRFEAPSSVHVPSSRMVSTAAGKESARLRMMAALCSGPSVSSTALIVTWSTEVCSHARSWKMSLTLAPAAASTPVSSAMPPGRSLTRSVRRTSRPSAARPRSMTRPSTLTSMLPPQSGTTTRFPLRSGRSSGPPGRRAARPVAPPPSTTIFCPSTSRSTASATSFSSTRTTSSTHRRATAKACGPTCGTARPSASVGSTSAVTGCPARSAAVYEAHRRGSTPTTCGRLTARGVKRRCSQPPPAVGVGGRRLGSRVRRPDTRQPAPPG
mmetsp:Transcript_4360/g.13153  ORF Transcript_4360/g.13153 Transcript_4360/m.13153 type:complete len:375 (+) Transcript_4360:278-1402(+)